MESKLRIKFGTMEVEYEGSETFIKDGLTDLLKSIAEFSETAISPESNTKIENNFGSANNFKLTTNSIAAKIKVTSGPELILAAASHLTFVKNKDVFSRKELLEEMKTATGYYKTSYSSNLTSYLQTLLSNSSVMEPSSGNFALNANKRKELETQVVE